MEPNQETPPVNPEVNPATLPPEVNSENKPKKSHKALFFLLGMFIVLILVGGIGGGYYFGINSVSNELTQTTPTIPPSNADINESEPSPEATIDDTKDWKIYNAPIIADSFSPFQISYPSAYTIKEEINQNEPKSLILTLTNSDNETIKILQGAGGGGTCVYKDDADYNSFQGMGDKYTTYIQITKPLLWRLTKSNNKSNTSYLVCQKNNQGRYLDGTEIGWITVTAKSDSSLQEIKSILETVNLKPTSTTKTIFN